MLKGTLKNSRQSIKRLAYVPTLDELNANMVQALTFRGRVEELSWVDPDSNIEYKLQCLCKLSDTSVPCWELLMLKEGQWQVILRHESTDTILMFNSVMDAIGRNENKAQSDGAMYANSARCNEGDKISDSFRHFATSTKLQKVDVDAMGGLLEPNPESLKTGAGQNTSPAAANSKSPVSAQISDQTVVEYFQALLNIGLQPDSVLVKCEPNMPLTSIGKRVSSGLPFDLAPQINFYSAIDGRLSINDLIVFFNFGRQQWVPIVWNLINCNLVALSGPGTGTSESPSSGSANSESKTASGTANALCRAGVDRIRNGLLDQTSGLYTFDAMLFLLDYEGKRMRRARQSVTLFVFKVNRNHRGVQQLVAQGSPIDQLMVKAVEQAKRNDEILAHFDAGSYAIIMPSTRPASAANAINRFLKQLVKAGLGGPDPNSGAPPICIALVSMPDHASDLAELILAARTELDRVETLCLGAP